MNRKPALIIGLVTIGVLGRLVPHLPNATPMNAISLAAREHLGARWAYTIVIAAMLASDALLGFYDWRLMLGVYAAWAAMTALYALRPRHSSIMTALAFAILGALLFYFTTNTAVWALSPWYAKSLSGLIECLTAGLPFLRTMLLGDAIYVPTILLGVRLVTKGLPTLMTSKPRIKISSN